MTEEEDESLDALENELNQMGLSVEDLQPPEDGHFDRRAMARVESARIMSRRFIERDRVKDRINTQAKVRAHSLLPSYKRARFFMSAIAFCHARSSFSTEIIAWVILKYVHIIVP